MRAMLMVRVGVVVVLTARGVDAAEPLKVFKRERHAYRVSVADLLARGRLEELESKAESLRAQRTRFSSGAPVLFDFYEALNPAVDHVDSSRREGMVAQLEQWKRSSQSAIPRVALARMHLTLPWVARSNKYAPQVTRQEWEGFKAELQKAWEMGNEALGLKGLDPVVYDTLLAVGVGQSLPRPELDKLFKEGSRLDPEYDHIYVVLARNLMPRWHGSPAKLAAFASAAAERTKKTYGDGIYARIAAEGLTLYAGGDFDELKGEFPWPRLQQGLVDLDKAHPNSSFILNTYCLLASRYEEFATAKALFDRLEGQWSEDSQEVWRGREYFEQMRDWVRWEAAKGGNRRRATPGRGE